MLLVLFSLAPSFSEENDRSSWEIGDESKTEEERQGEDILGLTRPHCGHGVHLATWSRVKHVTSVILWHRVGWGQDHLLSCHCVSRCYNLKFWIFLSKLCHYVSIRWQFAMICPQCWLVCHNIFKIKISVYVISAITYIFMNLNGEENMPICFAH